MDRYINPPLSVKEIGRPLLGLSFPELVAQLGKDEELVGLYDRGVFMNAVNLTAYGRDTDTEFWEFENQVGSSLIRLGFFAVPTRYFID